MLVRDFDFRLPDELIAQQPQERGASRLFDVNASGPDRHRTVSDLPSLLQPSDLLVVNDTRVIPARLFGRREPGGGRVELLLAERSETSDIEWSVLLKPGRRSRPGTVVRLDDDLWLEVVGRGHDGRLDVRFSEPIEPHLERLGHVPLPPYIKRDDDASDRERYQTVYAERPGAIAAPTAGLHFSDELLDEIEAVGVQRASITLHVGLGTFKPVTSRLVHEHRMDAERLYVPEATVEAIAASRACGGRVVAVGTTVVRALEGSTDATGRLRAGWHRTELFVTPGFDFRSVDALLTNFHLPKSTLLMLVCAFGGTERVLAAYQEAVEYRYRFYSYGDAMWLGRRAISG